MAGKILIVTATETEASVFRNTLRSADSSEHGHFGGTEADILVTGIGTMACAFSLMNYFQLHGLPSLAISAGIAGSYNPDISIGEVVIVRRDCFAGFGIDDRGRFIPAIDAGFIEGDGNPYSDDGWIECKNSFIDQLSEMFPFCTGITSDTVSGSNERVVLLKKRFNPDIETMEGASFFYICALKKVPFIALRAVSNRVEERDRNSWNIPLALANLEKSTRGIIRLFTGK
jgi:futalosine hydrolase